MGVPYFYRQLTKKYRNIAQRLKRYEVELYFNTTKKVETLGLDLNGIIHTEAAKVYLYGDYETKDERTMAKLRAAPAKQLENQHFKGITDAIFEMVQLTRPRDGLFVCVDGPAPFPKLYQQKQRRFKAKSMVIEERDEYSVRSTEYRSSSIFDSNCITPGTAFMDRLDTYLADWLNANLAILGVQRIVYSGHRVPGEGEHKIADYHRTLTFDEAFAATHTHVVYGLDADLIMIGMLSPLKNYTLLRDDITAEQGTFYHVLDIEALRNKVRDELGSVEDYVLMTFFAGNDFLPAFPSISIGRGGLESLIEIYLRGRPRLVREDGVRVNWAGLHVFMTAFAAEEPQLLEAEAKSGSTYPSIPLEAAMVESAGRKVYDHERFRGAYYQRALGSKSEEVVYNSEGLQSTAPLAEEWLAGLAWIFRYYTEGIENVNVEWVYHFNYVPLAQEIVTALGKVVAANEVPDFEWDAIEVRGEVLKPYEQLVSVLPPASQHLLPAVLQSLLTSANSPLLDLIPTQFLADRNGKMKEHEEVALLPYIDGPRVREVVSAIELPATFARRNTFAEDMFIKRYRVLPASQG
jgi:5'-3' exoribonuclease 1